MFGLTVSEAAAICGGSVSDMKCDAEITSVAIDSRAVMPGSLFVAYRGERTDGHRFIASALEKGAVCALAEYLPEGVSGPVIICEDVQFALEKLTAAFRSMLTIPVIGITGSVGKTTAKEMVSSVLAQRYCVHKTAGNLNNTIGLPVSIGGIQREHEAAVIEMGINHFGEMDRLGAMAKPDVMLYTRIGHAHLEFLGDLNGVFRAKTEVLSHMRPDALVIYNGDDPYLTPLHERENHLSFGRGKQCDVRADNVSFTDDGTIRCDIAFHNRRIPVRVNSFGEHMVYAALEGAAVGFAMGLSDEEIVAGIASYETVGRRFSCRNTGFIRLIDDCYNANPDSMRSSIDSLMDFPTRHVCVLGEMLELGRDSEKMHYEVGAYAREKGVDLMLLSGPLCAHTAEGFGKNALLYPDKASLMAAIPSQLRQGDTVLVKASLGSKYAEISDFLSNYHPD